MMIENVMLIILKLTILCNTHETLVHSSRRAHEWTIEVFLNFTTPIYMVEIISVINLCSDHFSFNVRVLILINR
ncbi:unnamed protein product [Trifolium pratense]|uniref:Uncharacterized protein n=1 Tax=Trifolium pratense TaxID=57577 RepID=A0ACB0LTL1_TRIPR|nr:unnamed protein product [Trifolium pratense]